MGIEEIRKIKAMAGMPKEKKFNKIDPVSKKRAAKIAEEKEARGGEDTLLQKWFTARRKDMTGTCACGCKQPSAKKDNLNFRSSCCHIFPQRLFPSIMYHPVNFIERAIWATNAGSSCHTNMDNQSMDLWPTFADWNDIKEKFHILAPLLTDEERSTKFYTQLEKLIYSN